MSGPLLVAEAVMDIVIVISIPKEIISDKNLFVFIVNPPVFRLSLKIIFTFLCHWNHPTIHCV